MIESHPINPSQGINVGSLDTYGTGLQTLNLMKSADGWRVIDITTFEGGFPVDPALFDAQGWPTQMPVAGGAELQWATGVTWSEVLPKGNYVITWEGEGEFELFKSVVERGDHRIVFEVGDRGGTTLPDGIQIVIQDTDPEGVGNHLRNFKVFRLEDEAAIEAGEIWRPEYLDKIGDFRVLRTMAMQEINSSPIVEWDDIQQSAQKATWTIDVGGAPIGALVDLANETNSDLWVNVPHLATDDFVREMATYIRDNLDPDLRVYLEYSNEHWTPLFSQQQWFVDKGNAAFGEGFFNGPQYYVSRAADVATLFGEVFGAENDPRYFPLFTIAAGFIEWDAYVNALLNGPDAKANGGTAAVDGPFKAIAIDTYYDGGAGWSDNRETIKGWLANGQDYAVDKLYEVILGGSGLPNQTSIETLQARFEAWGEIARANGWQLLSYEGGTGFTNFDDPSDQAYTDLMMSMNRDPRISILSQQIIDAFQAAGGSIIAHFADFGRDGYFGNWATWEDVFTEQPFGRGNAFVDANHQTPTYVDERDGRVFIDDRLLEDADKGVRLEGGTQNDDLRGGIGSDILLGGGGDDTLDGDANPETAGDILIGGRGDDRYVVDSAADIVDEGIAFGGEADGYDRIVSTADFYWDFYSAGEWLEIAPDASDGGGVGSTAIGSVFSNAMVGNSSTNVLFGRGGSDVYIAGDGIDYISLSTLGLTADNAYDGVDGSNRIVVTPRSTGPVSYDIVFEFESGRDLVDVSSFAVANNLVSGLDVLARGVNDGRGNSYFVLGDGFDYLYLVGIEKEALSPDDFVTS